MAASERPTRNRSRAGGDDRRLMIGSTAAVTAMLALSVMLLMFSEVFAAAQQAIYQTMSAMADICRL